MNSVRRITDRVAGAGDDVSLDWLNSPETDLIFDALQGDADEPQIMFVGGCVRNALLGVPVVDVDLATTHHPEDVAERLRAAQIKVVPTGIDHGTVTAVIDGKSFEITTLRRDVETNGRHAVVAFTDDWAEDAARRDFTINTLLMDERGNIYDPLRSGIIDLEARRVVFVGDPATRIAEDYLRILRFFRFHAQYGAGAPDPSALAACRNAAPQIKTLSRERITQEFLKIIGAENAADTFRIMYDNEIMADLANPEFDDNALRALIGLQNRSQTRSVAARLYCICGGREEKIEIADEYLLLSKMLRRNFESLFEAVQAPMNIRERLYHYGREVGGQSILLLAAMRGAKISDDDLALIREWDIPKFPLAGSDLQKLGVEPGPHMGEILDQVETWWIEWEFRPDHGACVDRAKEMIK
jgi:poly(A) polymerase